MVRKLVFMGFIFSQFVFAKAKEKTEKIEVNKKTPNKVVTVKKKAPKNPEKDKKLSLKEVWAYQKSMDTPPAMSFDFNEELYRNVRKKTIHKKGSVYAIKPDKFKWQVGSNIWLYDGKDLLQYNKEEKYAVRYSSKLGKSKELRQLVDMITNFEALLKSYNFEGAFEKEKEIIIKLKPKGASEIEALEVTLSLTMFSKKKKTSMKKLVLFFADKNITRFKFSNRKEEKVELKRLSPPKGTKITDAL